LRDGKIGLSADNFSVVVDWRFYRGFYEKRGAGPWCFDGVVVVDCVVNVVF
jgi:hypothetical protein